jgi:hypothetical protein
MKKIVFLLLNHRRKENSDVFLYHKRMARGGHGLPQVLPRPAMPYPFTSCGWATPETAVSTGCRVGGLRSSSTLLDTPSRTPMFYTIFF